MSEVSIPFTLLRKIASFWKQVNLSSLVFKEEVIFETCSTVEKANMVVSNNSNNPYFYFYLPVVHDIGVLIHFPHSRKRF